MSFDTKKFLKTEFEARTEEIKVPDLNEYFKDGTDAVWVVRGLTGHELGHVNEATDKYRNIDAIVESLLSDKSKEKAGAIKQLIGMDSSTPGDIVRRLELLKFGSVDPICDDELAVKLCTFFPIEFMILTNAITKLSGQGAVKKKQTNSGDVRK